MKYIYLLLIGVIVASCNNFLDEEVYTEYDPETFLNNEAGIEAVLAGAYKESEPAWRETWGTFQFAADLELERGGGYATDAIIFEKFEWDSSNWIFWLHWMHVYTGIRNANSLLDNIDNVTALSAEKIATFKAEATFLRAYDYYELYDIFGPVPIITTAKELNFEPSRATDEEMKTFIENELRSAAENLPVESELYGRATKGAALALLGRFYLNTKQWQKCADVLAEVIAMGEYQLFNQVEGLFNVGNKGNSELIFVFPHISASTYGWVYQPHYYPVGYPTDKTNFGAQIMLRRSFVESFHTDDRRALPYEEDNDQYGWILKDYTDKQGVFIDLMNDPIILGDERNYPRAFKITPDPNAQGAWHGNDMPILRYAEVLVSRAEALNEINGPNQESVDLLNQVRERAEAPLYQLSDFSTKEALRDQILEERSWEFFAEGLRRQDLIRHGKFISSALERGEAAQPFHTLFPIPQVEMDANPALVQNPGY